MKHNKSSKTFLCFALSAILLASLAYYYVQISGKEGMEGDKEKEKEKDFTYGAGTTKNCPNGEPPDNNGVCGNTKNKESFRKINK
jgi:hypothetical protein